MELQRCDHFKFSTPPSPTVLVVDDDLGTRETFQWALKASGISVRTAGCGAGALQLAKAQAFDLLLLDLELPDMQGIDVIRAIQHDGGHVPFVVISGFLTTEITVAAMKLGALEVLDKPLSIDHLPSLVRSAVAQGAPKCDAPTYAKRSSPDALRNLMRFAESARAGSVVERWVVHMVKGCGADEDPKTLAQWTLHAGVSYTTLRESCTLGGIDPHGARDLMRVLRAAIRSALDRTTLDGFLDVSDRRTLERLLERGGFHSSRAVEPASIEEFFRHQRFGPTDNPAVSLLRDVVLRYVR